MSLLNLFAPLGINTQPSDTLESRRKANPKVQALEWVFKFLNGPKTAPASSNVPGYASTSVLNAELGERKKLAKRVGRQKTNVTGGLYGDPTLSIGSKLYGL